MGLRLKTLWSVGYEAYLTYSELYFKKLLETGVFIYKKDIYPPNLDTLLMVTDAIISLIGYLSITFYLKGMMHMNLLGKILTTVIGKVFVVFAVLTAVNIYQTKNLTIETAQKMAQAETSNNAYQIQI